MLSLLLINKFAIKNFVLAKQLNARYLKLNFEI